MADHRVATVGTFVEPMGMIRSAVGGAIGGAVGAAVAASGSADGAVLARGQIGYLGVFPGEVILFAAKRGACRPKPTDAVIAAAPRPVVRLAQVNKGKIAGVLEIHLHDGTAWRFEVPRVHLGGAQKVAAVLSRNAY
ncbi:hypothetical protein [Frankia sp. QA3]|uniref:hypothetical protein n=1 Tax=Frankia sp. QA3 TaxID=710111 RepID=UPI000269B8A8|nr:hypothetical protein [Frankia sp. QA3]EIV90805.1 hypothetical protein FraQA3DRAFT_0208 [Frankia sp. QA3]